MLTNKCIFLNLSGKTIFEQLQIEEALLRNYKENICIINSNAPEAVVLGISRRPNEDIHIPKLRSDNVPIIKRYSGGGTVFIDENSLFVTWIMNSSEPMANSQDLMQWSYGIYAPIFPEEFSVNENDYTLGEKKFAGNAQYIQKSRWVHHTTFLWDMDIDKLTRYLPIPQKQPSYRKQRLHQDFLTTIRPWFPTKESFFDKLKASASSIFHWGTLSEQELKDIQEKPHRKSTTLL
ncbi:lipoate--protein ligase family protein [Chlamydia caviae]|uniref:Lipoate-protein ligase A-related protein n=1 Tax=Chlamydia caviae (strain ATCC VR-813 / DSM 19441 / 03DC25 / GPIC) TaxID=227941 RepID=Q824M3_CHLCV|nr:lipoate--protein ligase family protein [Chlamydia caviae]AAP04874.1 lipoate-protein ligase A-related protein [Chlamydia caviae GPIC]